MDKLPILYGDGSHDDTPAFQAHLDGKPYQLRNGKIIEPPEPDQTTLKEGK